ncbi:type I-E CRISPR-associated protein Cas5/CasD [Limnochorda pilosa]|uniref:CRISPR-associated protein Cas5 n=1 Tax=Limnochorda pilosa TaxID=1555112 RepID=A0A0K2SJX6_LIMPI|nr:type I-E CRISPR-associated protein Cas5/CasD [Limnochorda pilosa]BAS27312.1 CRISPR-associated protein Cas5 [Limnochorda pilosa]
MATLLFRLEGPLQSWGTGSRFSTRETGLEPSKSGVIGLICAALGKPREEHPEYVHQWPSLASLTALRLGVRVDRAGRLQRDFHTAGGSRSTAKGQGVIRADASGSDTVTSQRYYLADASFLVGLEGDPGLLSQVESALREPVWPIFLGRKACVPSRPAHLPDGWREGPLPQALATYPWLARTLEEENAHRSGVRVKAVLDAVPDERDNADQRFDVPLSFAERRFAPRRVVTMWMDLSADQIRRDPLCTFPA